MWKKAPPHVIKKKTKEKKEEPRYDDLSMMYSVYRLHEITGRTKPKYYFLTIIFRQSSHLFIFLWNDDLYLFIWIPPFSFESISELDMIKERKIW